MSICTFVQFSTIRRPIGLSLRVGMFACSILMFTVESAAAGNSLPDSDVLALYTRLALSFEVVGTNHPGAPAYLSRNPQFDILLSPSTMLFQVKPYRAESTMSSRPIRVRLENARSEGTSEVLDPLPGHTNYLKGPNPSCWRTNVPVYGKVRFDEVYPGIDVVYYGTQGRLEYDFVVQPGGDPQCIIQLIEGADGIALSPNGDLELHAEGGTFRLLAPEAYQDRGGERRPVPAKFLLDDRNRLSFSIGDYDRSCPLVIDPIVEFSSFVGVPSANARGMGVDDDGNMYIAGFTSSPDLALSGANYDTTLGGDSDIFVVKFNPGGNEVIYSTYVGGSDAESGKAMYVDGEGYAYIGGNTKSSDLPTTGHIGHYGPTYDFLVVKVNRDGDGLEYCCVFGGEGMEEIRGITADSQGNCIAVGGSHSPDLPTTPGSYQPVYKDPPEDTPEVAGSFTKGEDAVIAKINPTGTDFVFCSWLGGHGFEKAWAVATDKSDDIYLAGHVEALDFPVTEGAFQSTHAGGTARSEDQYGPKDAFVAKLSADGTRLLAATYFGGSGQDVGYGIGLDDTGNVYVAGNTESPDLPLKNAAFDTFAGGDSDVYVVRFDSTLSHLHYATYFGGPGKDELSSDAFDVDRDGNAYAAGVTSSQLPVTSGAFLETYGGGDSDGYLVRFTPDGRLDYCTLLGGADSEQCGALAVDHRGGAYIAGRTSSTNFMLQRPYRDSLSGRSDAFLVKIQFDTRAKAKEK